MFNYIILLAITKLYMIIFKCLIIVLTTYKTNNLMNYGIYFTEESRTKKR